MKGGIIVNRKLRVLAILLLAILIITSTSVYALTPGQLTGTKETLDLGFIDKITDFIKVIGTFLSVGVLMVLGIRYMMGSLEERASYKKSMMPYIVGCVILFGASYIVPAIIETTSDIGDSTDEVGNKILGLIQVTGTFISIGALMVLGIKYMMGSVEERASYKKSMIPYIVGIALLFSAVNIASIIYEAVPKNYGGASAGRAKAQSTYSEILSGSNDPEKIKSDLNEQISEAENKKKSAKSTEESQYYDALQQTLRDYKREIINEEKVKDRL